MESNKEFKGTKGDWKRQKPSWELEDEYGGILNTQSIKGENNIVIGYILLDEATDEECEANGKLIQTSLELLEALIDLKEQYKDAHERQRIGDWDLKDDDVYINAEKAIEKALN